MNTNGLSWLIGDDDDYSTAWLSRRIPQLNREILQRVAERDKWQAMLDQKFAKHKAPKKSHNVPKYPLGSATEEIKKGLNNAKRIIQQLIHLLLFYEFVYRCVVRRSGIGELS